MNEDKCFKCKEYPNTLGDGRTYISADGKTLCFFCWRSACDKDRMIQFAEEASEEK